MLRHGGTSHRLLPEDSGGKIGDILYEAKAQKGRLGIQTKSEIDMSVINLTEAPIVACSAPGKVLLAGGYLVLDRQYTGLVFGLDARIHVLVQSLPESQSLTFSDIIVRSPQFRDAEWRYRYEHIEGGGVHVTQVQGWVSLSCFIQNTISKPCNLRVVLNLACELLVVALCQNRVPQSNVNDLKMSINSNECSPVPIPADAIFNL